MKLISWNVNGLRAAFRNGLREFILQEKPDIFCVQETKLGAERRTLADLELRDYQAHFSFAERKGYSGLTTYVHNNFFQDAILLKKGIGILEIDREARVLITEHPQFTLYNVYCPSGTSGEIRQNFKYGFLEAFTNHLKALPQATRENLIICGDFNICHKDIDIHHPKEATRRRLTGFLPEERRWLDTFVGLGFVDTFRFIHADIPNKYSWWTFRAGARSKNLGWRIDYIYISQSLANTITRAEIFDQVLGSDHCPILVELGLQ